MEVSYGIGVTNRYALFLSDENEDPLETLKSEKEHSTTAKKTEVPSKQEASSKSIKQVDLKGKDGKIGTTAAPATGAAKKGGPKETQPNAKSAEQIRTREDGYQPRGGLGGRPVSGRGDRGGRFANEGRVERNNRRNEDRPPREFGVANNADASPGNGAPDGEYRPRNSFRGTFRGGRDGRGAGRGGRGGRGGKREFDRQSGSDKSGVKAQEKREGSGAHNWGSVKDEIEGQMEPAAVADEVVEGEQDTSAVETTEVKEPVEGESAPAVPAEEEPKEYTLDEWKAKQGERKKPEFNIRQAGEGEDNTQWKKTFVLEKKKLEEEEDEEEEIIDVSAEYPQRVGRQKFLNIDIRFADSRRGTRGRGAGGRGRGAGGEGGYRGERGDRPDRPERGDRGDRGDRPDRGERTDRGGDREGPGFRGGYRGGRGSSRGSYAQRGPAVPAAPKVDDEKDFPALG